MAILTLDSLTGCTKIRDFIGGESDTPSNPSKMIFYQTSAPTSWVKETTHNNKSLRVIGGIDGISLSPGGSNPFTTIFTNPFPGSYVTSPGSGSYTVGINVVPFSLDSYTDQNTTQPATLNVAQMATHTHSYNYVNPPTGGVSVAGMTGTNPNDVAARNVLSQPNVRTTGQATSANEHNHTFSAPHSHAVQIPHNHTATGTTTHSHQATSSQNFSIYYVDVIIAKKS